MPIKPVFDLHTHTMASGHAYSTLLENLTEAKHKGLLAMGTSDHSPGMIHTTHKAFFENYKILPRTFEGVRLLRGMEANIIDYEGTVDGGLVMKDLDYVIASLHTPCIKSGSVEDNTRAIIGAMKNPWVKIIGHPDDARYPIDIEKVDRPRSTTGWHWNSITAPCVRTAREKMASSSNVCWPGPS